ncbi:hypothetical protein [Fodinicola feengrottensis]|uniref:Uncharacterized protein n=1 Tax=Fodinicola feengrottensis TaxID=435914 RepID=A0ABP4URR9_9ACTN|nr:hypothetical protein [Fodinicola feengrottensis]
MSGCVRTCPAGQVAVVLAGREGCREWAVEPARQEQTERLIEGLVSLSRGKGDRRGLSVIT